MSEDCHTQGPSHKGRTLVLTQDDALCADILEEISDFEGGDRIAIIDPSVSAQEVCLAAQESWDRVAVWEAPDCGEAIFVALQHMGAELIEDPRTSPVTLRRFLAGPNAGLGASADRRAYPRTTGEGVRVVSPEGVRLVDVAPYGARASLSADVSPKDRLVLSVVLERSGVVDTFECEVLETLVQGREVEQRLRFESVSRPAQEALLAMAKATIARRAIDETLDKLAEGPVEGFVHLSQDGACGVLSQMREGRSRLTFSTAFEGRTVRGQVVEVDPERFVVEVARRGVPEGSVVRFMGVAGFRSCVMEARILSVEGRRVRLAVPHLAAMSDRRVARRAALGEGSRLTMEIEGHTARLVGLSAGGFSIESVGAIDLPLGRGLRARVWCEGRDLGVFAVLLRGSRPGVSGIIYGGSWLGDGALGLASVPLVETRFEGAPVERSGKAIPGERVCFESEGRSVVGLWTQARGACEALVVIPPAWSKTKESTGLMAQLVASSFAASGRGVAVLRFDYTNSLGESFRDEPARRPGFEASRLRPSACVEDIRAAVRFGMAKLGGAPGVVALVGMSFSGPLCLRVAAEGVSGVTHLIQYMGASDIHDLTRTSSGGLDFVARHRGGLGGRVENVLGVLSHTDVWCADGLEHRLLFYQHAQRDSARLTIPLLWIQGDHDAFVDGERVRGLLEVCPSPDKRLVRVPYGHIPTHSKDAVRSSLPVVSGLLRAVGATTHRFALPEEAELAPELSAEWRRAPRVQLASAQQFWRSYMLGSTEDGLGFDVLALTAEYKGMMQRQVELLGLAPGAQVCDLGGGMGHSLPFMAGREVRVSIFDLVPEVMSVAQGRAEALGVGLEVRPWDAASQAPPEALRCADRVLMSLFLSCLPDPAGVLDALWARLPEGAVVVASSIRPDADMSAIYKRLMVEIQAGRVPPPGGMKTAGFAQAVRDYMNSAAWLLRLAEEGTFRLFDEVALPRLFEDAGFEVERVEQCFGEPARAVVVKVRKGCAAQCNSASRQRVEI